MSHINSELFYDPYGNYYSFDVEKEKKQMAKHVPKAGLTHKYVPKIANKKPDEFEDIEERGT